MDKGPRDARHTSIDTVKGPDVPSWRLSWDIWPYQHFDIYFKLESSRVVEETGLLCLLSLCSLIYSLFIHFHGSEVHLYATKFKMFSLTLTLIAGPRSCLVGSLQQLPEQCYSLAFLALSTELSVAMLFQIWPSHFLVSIVTSLITLLMAADSLPWSVRPRLVGTMPTSPASWVLFCSSFLSVLPPESSCLRAFDLLLSVTFILFALSRILFLLLRFLV